MKIRATCFMAMAIVLSFFLISCSSSGSGGNGASDSGVRISGTLSGTAVPNLSALKLSPKNAAFNDDPNLCPDSDASDEAVSENLSPTSYTVALKKLTLLGDDSTGTADYEIFSADSVDEAYIADFVNDTTFFSSESYPTSGTYDGFEIEVFYVEMTISLIVPAISNTEASYTTRGYFAEVGNIDPRDVTIFSEGSEYWINRKTDDPNPFELVAVTGDHPDQVLDLWADESFWGRDPITISTDDDYGTSFNFGLADGSESLTISDNPSGLYDITFNFDVANTFTFWEYLENQQAADADGTFTVGYDCGYRIFFPDVEIEVEEDAGST